MLQTFNVKFERADDLDFTASRASEETTILAHSDSDAEAKLLKKFPNVIITKCEFAVGEAACEKEVSKPQVAKTWQGRKIPPKSLVIIPPIPDVKPKTFWNFPLFK